MADTARARVIDKRLVSVQALVAGLSTFIAMIAGVFIIHTFVFLPGILTESRQQAREMITSWANAHEKHVHNGAATAAQLQLFQTAYEKTLTQLRETFQRESDQVRAEFRRELDQARADFKAEILQIRTDLKKS